MTINLMMKGKNWGQFWDPKRKDFAANTHCYCLQDRKVKTQVKLLGAQLCLNRISCFFVAATKLFSSTAALISYL